jgi:adenosylcobinamide kinase/adenosylcobinamide-phosphate guanylyltransferase
MKTLVLGGARSGKSAWAAALAQGHGDVVLIATALALDAEMAARIARHRAERPAHWRTVEAPRALGAAIAAQAAPGRFVIVDCLTLWLTNLLAPMAGEPAGALEADWAAERAALLAALARAPGEIALVGNEIGYGVMPVDALSRRFIDAAGRLHQDVARVCERVVWMVAGCPLVAKGGVLSLSKG